MDLTDIYRAFNPMAEEYTFFSLSFGTFSSTDLMGHKTGLKSFFKN
jgi:hypothetical protein